MGEAQSKGQSKNTQEPPKEGKTEPKNNKENNQNVNEQENQNNINNNNLNDINFQGITGGNSEGNQPKKVLNKNKKNKKNDMVNKLEKRKQLNIDVDNNISDNKIDKMMMSVDNFHSKKIEFTKNQEQKKDIKINENKVPEKKKEEYKKNNSPIKNIMQYFRNNNNEEKINKNLPSNRKIKPRNYNLNNQKDNLNNYNKENYNTNNNEENQKSFRKIIANLKINENLPKKDEINMENEIKKIQKNEDKNINNQINNDVGMNINKEIKSNEKKEDDDLDSNLNINNLKENKKKINNSINLEIENNPSNNNLPSRKIVRSNTNLNPNSDTIAPQKIFLFDDFNIFDSFLLILNNNTYINKYLEKNKGMIYDCAQHNKNCLSIILYYINRYLWMLKPETIIRKNDLYDKYKEFQNCYLIYNCKNERPDLYFYNTNNLEAIIYFIFYKINSEISAEHKIFQPRNFGTGNKLLNEFMDNFMRNNKSVISDCFTGFYQVETTCINCKNRMERYRIIYNPNKVYSSFNYIYLDLENIGNQYANQYGGYNRRSMSFSNFGNSYNQNYSMNFNLNMNLYNCLNQEFNQCNLSVCNLCQINTQKYIQKQFYSPPKVLTIIINNKNANFTVENQIYLSQYTHIKGNHSYNLIAMLCKYTYNNQFVTYCFNSKDGNWYYYTKIEGLFSKNNKKTTFLDPNAIPYVLVYQDIENMKFEYKEINLNIANNKKGYLFRFQNNLPQVTLYFGINTTVKEVTKAISNYFKLDKVRLLINANPIKENDILSQVAENNVSIVVLTV